MRNFFYIGLLLGLGLLVLGSFLPPTQFEITNETPLWEVMTRLGKINENSIDKRWKSSVTKGKELVMTGMTTDFKNKRNRPISRNLPCIACHTIQPEYDTLSVIDPQARLEFADSVGIPFLPGTPFYGMVNRIMFFNDDYSRDYIPSKASNRDYITGAHRSIRKAINACNVVHADGRDMEKWEIESILAFLWTLELKMGDIAMETGDLQKVENSINTNMNNARAVNLLRRYYPEVYPATFPKIPKVPQRKRISPVLNDFNNGKILYKRSCLYCHLNKRYSKFELDNRDKTFKFLEKHLDNDSKFSLYNTLRYDPESKKNTDAPHFTKQRMSTQQIQDLRFFITEVARLGEDAYAYHKPR